MAVAPSVAGLVVGKWEESHDPESNMCQSKVKIGKNVIMMTFCEISIFFPLFLLKNYNDLINYLTVAK